MTDRVTDREEILTVLMVGLICLVWSLGGLVG